MHFTYNALTAVPGLLLGIVAIHIHYPYVVTYLECSLNCWLVLYRLLQLLWLRLCL
jgi:hypothetical protein